MSYSKEFKNRLEKIETEAKTTLDSIQKYNNQIKNFVESSETDRSAITAIVDEFTKQKETFDKEIRTILEVLEDNPDLSEETENLATDIETIKDLKNKISVIYKQIYGYDIKNDNGEIVSHEEGIRDRLEKSYNDLSKKITTLETVTKNKYETNLSEWTKSIDNLKKDIEKLLPGATSAGLASAYEEKQKDEIKSLQWSFGWFVGIIILMVGIGFSLFLPDIAPKENDYIGFVSRILLLAPLIWIGIYQNKKLNISKKIIEEYAHKASIMKTFDGLLKQMFQTNKNGKYISSDTVRETFLLQTLNAVSRNPADCISECNKSDNPMIDIIKIALKNKKNPVSADTIKAIFNGVNSIKKSCSSDTSDK